MYFNASDFLPAKQYGNKRGSKISTDDRTELKINMK